MKKASVTRRSKTETYVLMTLAPAKNEASRIVADEGDAFAGIAWLRAEVARLDSLDC
jgi:hypothetical protein